MHLRIMHMRIKHLRIKHMRIKHFRRLALPLLLLLAASCTSEETATGPGIAKHVARGMDQEAWGEDLCESSSWYGDGECDDFCPEPDSDCNAVADAEAQEFLSAHAEEYAAVARKVSQASWDVSTRGDDEAYEARDGAQIELFLFSTDSKRLARIKEFYDRRKSMKVLTRRALEVIREGNRMSELPLVELLELRKVQQLQNDARKEFAAFSAEVDGESRSRGELSGMLTKESDPAKREVIWEALTRIGIAVGPKMIEGVRVAREVVPQLNCGSIRDCTFAGADQNGKVLDGVFAEVERLTEEPFKIAKAEIDQETAARFGITPADLMPWHYDDYLFQGANASDDAGLDEFFADMEPEAIVEIGANFYRKLDLEVDDVVAKSDLYAREGKSPSAFTLLVDRGERDVRVLMSTRPTFLSASTVIHEFGHVANWKYLDPSLPFWLRTYNHKITTEMFAMFFEDQALTSHYLLRETGADAALISERDTAIRKHRMRSDLIFARFSLVMYHFEKGLYEDPDQDLNALWWRLVERYQLIKTPQEYRDRPVWASKSHISQSPLTYHNYLVGMLFGAQLRAAAAREVSFDGAPHDVSVLDDANVAEFVKTKAMRTGLEFRWHELVEVATGEKLGASYFIDELR